MFCYKFLIFILVPLRINGIKVNMQGSLTLGKEVVDVFKNLLESQPSGRRSLSEKKVNKLSITVETAQLCADFKNLCDNSRDEFIKEYIIALLEAIESIFEELIQTEGISKFVIFESEITNILTEVKKLMFSVNDLTTDKSLIFYWINIIKRINGICQIKAVSFAAERIEGDNETELIKKRFVEKLTITLTNIEIDYESKLCTKHKICVKRHDCTIALNEMLSLLVSLDENKNKAFIRHFAAALGNSNFYSILHETTAIEFQNILGELSYSRNISAKSVLKSVHDIVADRVEITKNNKLSTMNGTDVKLINIILSDIDHTYSRHKKGLFKEFLNDFSLWASANKKIGAKLQQTMKDIAKVMSFETDDILTKLVNEIRTFLALTVEP